MTQEPIRVVQWTTGNVGRRAACAIARHPGLDLIGCFAWSPDKIGRDVGDLVGIEPLGVVATDDVDALFALQPDCVSYNPLWPDVDEMCRILGAGVNVASTAAFITGRGLGTRRPPASMPRRATGGVSLFGTGINPGFANLFALLSTGICDRVDKVTVLESVDATGYASAETQLSVGFAHDPDDPETKAKTDRASIVFGDAVALMGDALGLELDEIGFEVEYAPRTQDMDLGFMTIPAGHGRRASTCCRYGSVDGRRVIECRVRWKMGAHHGARLAAEARLLRRGRGRARASAASSRSSRAPTGTSPTTWASA